MAPPRTRLLVLGVVRIFGPVHGYDVRRELLSWRMQDWMNIQPGSIYSALKTLEKDGLVETVDDPGGGGPGGDGSGGDGPDGAGGASGGGGVPKRSYRVTAEGEKVFQAELRAAWWRVERAAEPLIPALCLMPFMPRAELIAAIGARVQQLGADGEQLRFQRALNHDGATGADGGIPEHVQPSVFEPFFTTKPEGKGTGLGLSTVLMVVERHNGKIDFTSNVGQGTTFRITLPAAPRA